MLRRFAPWLLAALTALLYLLPTILVLPAGQREYFVRQFYDEEYYATLAAATARGEPLLSNPYLGEVPDTPARSSEAVTFLPRYATAFLVHAFGLGASFTLLHVLVPFAVWLLIFFLLCRVTRSPIWAAAGACCVLLLPYYLFPAVSAAKALLGLPQEYFVTHPFWIGLPYARRFNPALSAIALFGFLALHWRGAETRQLLPRLLAALLGGLLFYCYFFFGVFALGFAVVWSLAAHALEKQQGWQVSAGLLALQVVVAIPFLRWTLQSMSTFESVTVRSHEPYLPWPHILAMLLALGLLSAVLPSLARRWLVVLGLCALGVVNQHVLTGLYVEPWHFDAYVLAPLSGMVTCGALGLLPARWPRLRRPSVLLAGGVMLVSVSVGGLVQTAKSLRIEPMGQPWQDQARFDFVRGHTAPDDSLLLADSNAAGPSWLVAFTGRRVYVSRHMGFQAARDKTDYRRRAICLYWLRGAPEEEFRAATEAPWSLLYIPEGSAYGFHPSLLTEQVKTALMAEWQAAARSPGDYCRPEFRVDALLESGRWRFDPARVQQIFEVTGSVQSGEFRLQRVRYRKRE